MVEHNEQLNESLSSVLDGTASSDDIDRVLSHDKQDWQHTLRSYSLTSSALQVDKDTRFADICLMDSISNAIDKEDMLPKHEIEADNVVQLQASKPTRTGTTATPVWKKSFGSLALAASVAFVVVTGGSYLLNGEQAAPQALQASINHTVNTAQFDVRPLQQVQAEVPVMDPERLQAYLRQHAEQTTIVNGQGMLPMSRVVSYPIGQE